MNPPLSEFHIIDKYFAHLAPDRDDVVLGIGDDCALLKPRPDQHLAVTVDTLVAGRHFLPDVEPESLGHKVLAVSLSDLAAMGATPAWATLALTLPAVNPDWLQAFANGFSALANRYQLALVGGDTTRGPLSITVQAHGLVKGAQALRRDGASAGDLVYVTGTLGDAALALRSNQASAEVQYRLHWPQPRIAQGQALAGLASAAIDISDGLLADLGHVCKASGAGAEIHCKALPLSKEVAGSVEQSGDWSLPLAGGDDYELCFTLPEGKRQQLEEQFGENGWPLWQIGMVKEAGGVTAVLEDGTVYQSPVTGFDHFADER